MAKRAGKGGFVMAAEIRNLLEADNGLTGPQVVAALQKKFPSQEINRNSASVAFAHARKALGIASTRKVKRRRRPVRRGRPLNVSAPATPAAINLEILQAAKALLQKCSGDAATATSALKSVAMLQMD